MIFTVWPEPGTGVYVFFMGKFKHYGVISDKWMDNKPMVIANAWVTGGVKEISLDQFSQGAAVYLANIPTNLPKPLILANARRHLGRRYSLFVFNCEHFVQLCHGNQPLSSQVAAVSAVALIAIGIAYVGMSQ